MNNNKTKNMDVVERHKSIADSEELMLITARFITKLLELDESNREKAITDLEQRTIKECDKVGADKVTVSLYMEELKNTIKLIIAGGYEINTMKLNEAIKNQQF